LVSYWLQLIQQMEQLVDRMKLYVNGVQETSLATDTYPSSSQNSILNDGTTSEQ
jgi:hypothetical protein